MRGFDSSGSIYCQPTACATWHGVARRVQHPAGGSGHGAAGTGLRPHFPTGAINLVSKQIEILRATRRRRACPGQRRAGARSPTSTTRSAEPARSASTSWRRTAACPVATWWRTIAGASRRRWRSAPARRRGRTPISCTRNRMRADGFKATIGLPGYFARSGAPVARRRAEGRPQQLLRHRRRPRRPGHRHGHRARGNTISKTGLRLQNTTRWGRNSQDWPADLVGARLRPTCPR